MPNMLPGTEKRETSFLWVKTPDLHCQKDLPDSNRISSITTDDIKEARTFLKVTKYYSTFSYSIK